MARPPDDVKTMTLMMVQKEAVLNRDYKNWVFSEDVI